MKSGFDIYERLTAANLTIDHHESDLYVKSCQAARAIIKEYSEATGFKVECFISKVDNQLWFEIPFAYSPFWVNKLKNK